MSRPSLFPFHERVAIINRLRAAQKQGVSVRAWCAANDLGYTTVCNWLKGDRQPRRKVRVKVAPKPYAMHEQAFRTPGCFMVLFAHLALGAVEDMSEGLREGWISDELKFCPSGKAKGKAKGNAYNQAMPMESDSQEAMEFILGPDAEIVCGIINDCLGRERVTPEYLLHQARRRVELGNVRGTPFRSPLTR